MDVSKMVSKAETLSVVVSGEEEVVKEYWDESWSIGRDLEESKHRQLCAEWGKKQFTCVSALS